MKKGFTYLVILFLFTSAVNIVCLSVLFENITATTEVLQDEQNNEEPSESQPKFLNTPYNEFVYSMLQKAKHTPIERFMDNGDYSIQIELPPEIA